MEHIVFNTPLLFYTDNGENIAPLESILQNLYEKQEIPILILTEGKDFEIVKNSLPIGRTLHYVIMTIRYIKVFLA